MGSVPHPNLLLGGPRRRGPDFRRTEEKGPDFFVTRQSNATAAPTLADLARSLERFRHTSDRSHRPCSREVVHRLKIEPVLRRLAKGTA